MASPRSIDMPDARPSSRHHPPREVVPRKKACEQCSKTKVRCDQVKPVCTRCIKRRTTCVYTTPANTSHQSIQRYQDFRGFGAGIPVSPARPIQFPSPHTGVKNSGFISSIISPAATASPIENADVPENHGPQLEYIPQHDDVPISEPNAYWNGSALNFLNLSLMCTLDATKIRDRWLGDFIPSLNDKAKVHPPNVLLFVKHVFKTYPAMLLKKGHLPPYIHPSQLAGPDIPTPLANCLSLVRLWDGQVRGGEAMVTNTVKNEMDRLYRERQSYGQMELLAAFQAYMTYAMMVFFSTEGSSLVDRQVIVNLQDFGCEISRRGLVCPAEGSNSRPDWESWIVASTKRRCLYAMYLFDNLFCTLNGLPTFLGEELESLPVPAPKILWEATTRESWEKEYNSFLSTWDGGGLRIDELWPAPESAVEARRKRVDKWVESVDEFGMMLYAVTCITHGC